jgi:hypothetical protein
MKKIIMVLESGEEIFCGVARSVYKYLKATYNVKITPLHGDKQYALVKNVYSNEHDQLVSFKSVMHD